MSEEPFLLVAEETKADDTCVIGISKQGEDKNANLEECKNTNYVEKYDAKSQLHQAASRKRKRDKSRPLLKISLSLFSKRKTKRNTSFLSGSSAETIESQTCGSDEGIKNGVDDNNVVAKEIPDSTQVKKRKRIYKPRPPKICDICDKVFANSSNFSKHKRIHINEKPYKCDQCHKAFCQSNDLKRHIRTHSVHLDFSCDKCSSSFSCPSNLKRHKAVHMLTKPFQCSRCSSSFTRLSELKNHTKIHTNKDLFNCHLCGMIFSRNDGVKRHLSNNICRVSPEIVTE